MGSKVKNILLIGQNYASVMNSLAIGLKSKGVNVRPVSFEWSRSKYNNYDQFYFTLKEKRYNRITAYITLLRSTLLLLRLLFWADVVHVFHITRHWRPALDLWLINLLGRKKVVTFMGSEIRRPEITLEKNRYFESAFENEQYEYRETENSKNSLALQSLYARYHFNVVIWDTEEYLYKDLFKQVFVVPHASINTVPVSDTIEAVKGKLLVVHSPSAPIAKGTPMIVAAMDHICSKYPSIQFRLLHNISNQEYQRILQEADVLIDQMVWGAYGVATQQALEMGKVVMAHLSPHRKDLYGPDCPIVNITLENIEEEIVALMDNVALRLELGARGKEYYKRVHSPHAVAEKILTVYQSA